MAKPAGFSPRKVLTRFVQSGYTALNWHDPSASKQLALVINGRSVPTNSPETLQVGPERSDERDRDIVAETLTAQLVLPPRENPSKLLVITRFDRDGIAWHHLAPFEIIRITAMASGGEKLNTKVTPRKWHEQAGGWSWVLHEFDLPPGAHQIALVVDAVHPRTVLIAWEVWHSDA
jgi:hypothetical protein